MAEHDNYDKNILKALQSIDKSLDKIARYLNSLNTRSTKNKSTDEGIKKWRTNVKTCRFWFLNRCYWNHLVNNSDCDDWEYKRIYPVRETWVKED